MLAPAFRLFAFALLVSGCALWRGDEVAAPRMETAPMPAATALALAEPPAPARAALAAAPAPSAEEFMCADGAHVRLTYSPGRDEARISVNDAPAVALQRAEASAYRMETLALRRAGPRLVLTSTEAAVDVRSGDTLGAIAARHYGDRHYAALIAEANADQIADANLIYPGQRLRLPAAERRCRRAGYQQAAAAYNVRPAGDFAMGRRVFSAPSEGVPDQRRVRATSLDPR